MNKKVLLAVLAATLILTLFFTSGNNGKTSLQLEITDAIPTWIQFRKDPNKCLQATNGELKLFENTLSSLAVLNQEEIFHTPLHTGIQKFLSHGIYRKVNQNYIPVCFPKDYLRAVAKEISLSKSMKAHIVQYQLTLAGRFKEPTQEIIELVAKVAFASKPHTNRGEWPENIDLRPLARTVLASYGEKASLYAERAYSEISLETALGTGALQIASSTGYEGALKQVENFMAHILDNNKDNDVISLKDRQRLYELSYALYYSRDKAKNHLEPLKELMRRRVASRSSFGKLGLYPKQMCHILNELNGTIDEEYSYCFDTEYPFPQ